MTLLEEHCTRKRNNNVVMKFTKIMGTTKKVHLYLIANVWWFVDYNIDMTSEPLTQLEKLQRSKKPNWNTQFLDRRSFVSHQWLHWSMHTQAHDFEGLKCGL